MEAAVNPAHDDNLTGFEVTVFRSSEVPSEGEYFSCEVALGVLGLFLLAAFLAGRRKEAIFSLKWKDMTLKQASSPRLFSAARLTPYNPHESRYETEQSVPKSGST